MLVTAFLALLVPSSARLAGPCVSGVSAIDVCPSREPEPCLGRLDGDAGGTSILAALGAGVVPAAVARCHADRRAELSPARIGRRITARQIVRRLPGRRVPRMDPAQPPAA